MLRVAFVDDDKAFLARQLSHIERFAREKEVPCEAKTFNGGFEFVGVEPGSFDVIFLDIEMPGIDGLETAQMICQGDSSVCLIFVTNMAQYAIRGYEVNALDFVIKPVEYFTFADKLKKAMRFCDLRREQEAILNRDGTLVRVPFSQIQYIEKEKNYLIYHTGVMGCMNYWGFTWGGSSYALNTELLRDEWGFQGMVITDMMMNAGSNSVDQALRAGNDTWMAWGDAFTTLIEDSSSPTGVSVIRNAVKNMSYAIANSRAMDGLAPGALVTYKTSPWKIGLTAANIVVYGFIVAMAGYMVVRARDAKKNPEKYKQPKVKNTSKTLKL